MFDFLLTESFLALLAVNVVAAVGMNVVYVTGQLHLGQAGYLAVGAYTTAVLVTKMSVPLPLALAAAAAVSATAAVPLAMGTRHLRGIYFIMGTLAAGELIRILFANLDYVGGSTGYNISSRSLDVRVALAVMTLVLGAAAWLMATHTGRRMRAVFDDAEAAASLGVDVDRVRFRAMLVSAAIVGIAGGLYSQIIGFIAPDNFDIARSFEVAVYALLGGVHSVLGAVVGALVVTVLTNGVSIGSSLAIGDVPTIALGVLVIAAMAVRPDGLVDRRRAIAIVRRITNRRSTGRRAPRTPVTVQAGTDPVVSIAGVGKRYEGVVALEEVSLDIAPGEIVGVIGGNGAGKTTLIEVVSGRISDYTGSVRVAGQPVDGLGAAARSGIGVRRTFQEMRRFPHLTARESLELAGCAHDEIDATLRLAGLAERHDALTGALSASEVRSLDIVQAASSTPLLLMLDEPSAGMSEAERSGISDLIRTIRSRGVAILLVDHNLDVAAGLADRLAVLDAGRLIALGEPSSVLADANVRRAYLGDDEGAAGS